MSKSRAGFTLLEMLIATSVLGLVVGSSMMLTLRGNAALNRSSVMIAANLKARHALARVVEELQRAGGTLTPSLSGSSGSDTVTFTSIADIVNGNPVWSNSTRLARTAAPEDADDGVDNDHDGLIDEGQIVLTRDVGLLTQVSIVLCTDVPERAAGELANGVDDNGNTLSDESGFCLQQQNDLLTVRITIEQPGQGGSSVLSSVETSFNLRN